MATFFEGRKVKDVLLFEEGEEYFAYKNALIRLGELGYSSGSISYEDPIAVMKGEYRLPQKWHNLSFDQKKSVDAVMVSSNFREGVVRILFFNENI